MEVTAPQSVRTSPPVRGPSVPDNGVVDLTSKDVRRRSRGVHGEVVAHLSVYDSRGTRSEAEEPVAPGRFAANEFVHVTRNADPKSVGECSSRLFTKSRVKNHVVEDQIDAGTAHRRPHFMRDAHHGVKLVAVFGNP